MKAIGNQSNSHHHGKRANRRALENHVEIGTSDKRYPILAIVLKCTASESVKAAEATVVSFHLSASEIVIIYSADGDIRILNVLITAAAGRLIRGFQVDVTRRVEVALRENGVELRLYEVIYRLTEDVKNISENMRPKMPGKEIICTSQIIALFMSRRKRIFIGCEVQKEYLAHS